LGLRFVKTILVPSERVGVNLELKENRWLDLIKLSATS